MRDEFDEESLLVLLFEAQGLDDPDIAVNHGRKLLVAHFGALSQLF